MTTKTLIEPCPECNTAIGKGKKMLTGYLPGKCHTAIDRRKRGHAGARVVTLTKEMGYQRRVRPPYETDYDKRQWRFVSEWEPEWEGVQE